MLTAVVHSLVYNLDTLLAANVVVSDMSQVLASGEKHAFSNRTAAR
jgi:hypothetical protein